MELLLLLYAMLAGLAGVSGQDPARAHEVALGSATAIAADSSTQTADTARAAIVARVEPAPGVVRVLEDARLDDVALRTLALVPLSRQAPERRLE